MSATTKHHLKRRSPDVAGASLTHGSASGGDPRRGRRSADVFDPAPATGDPGAATNGAPPEHLRISVAASIDRARSIGRATLDETQEPNRTRVRALVADLGEAAADEIVPMGTMIVRADGGSMRTFSGGLSHENGWWPSWKRHRLQHFEGMAQRDQILLSECSPDVEWFQSEGRRFEFTDAGEKHLYTCDLEERGVDGRIGIVEVKRGPRDLDDAGYRRKLAVVAEICRLCDMDFRIVYRNEIFANRRHRANVELFASRRFARVDPLHLHRLETSAYARGSVLTYADLADLIEPGRPHAGKAVIQALLIRRRVAIDLTARLHDETPVTIV